MNITPLNSVSFGAKISRQTKGVYDRNGKRAYSIEYTKQQFLDSYDAQIRKIQEQKQKAIELDEFMRTPEVTELVEQLPEDGVVEVAANFSTIGEGLEDEVNLDTPIILYAQDDDKLTKEQEEILREENAVFPQEKAGGEIDKKAIIDWLKRLNSILNK